MAAGAAGTGRTQESFSIEGTHFEQETHEQGAVQGHRDRSWGRMEDVELHLRVLEVTACVLLHYAREGIHPLRLVVAQVVPKYQILLPQLPKS